MTSAPTKSVFTALDASEEALETNSPVTEIESICMSCYKNGITKLMLTKIPFYRDVIISSFRCDHCFSINNSIESANKIQSHGIRLKLIVVDEKDMNRELVKSDNATLTIPSLDFEIPANTQKGALTTVEGVFDRVISNLQSDIELRKDVDKETTEKLENFLKKAIDLKNLKTGKFEIIIDDPSGDSFIENPNAPNKDPRLTITYYTRTKEQNELIGVDNENDASDEALANSEDMKNEIVQFHNNCPNCNAICETNMKLTDIPYFKTVLIMCTLCESCGIRSSEVKSGTGIEEKGVRFTLKLTDASDLNRDLLKSETGTLEIPEIEFHMGSGTLGGKFTTIEGLLKDCRENLAGVSPFLAGGDSDTKKKSSHFKECLEKLEKIQNGEMLNVTVILDDPSGNSYLQNVYAPEDDPNMTVEHYVRDYEQNEILGLNDMKTENYAEVEAD